MRTERKPIKPARIPVRAKLSAKRAQAGSVSAKPMRRRQEITGWDADRILVAIANADAGNFRILGDFVAALLADDRVAGVLQTRTHGLLGMPLDFLGGDKEFQDLLKGGDDGPGLWYLLHSEAELSAFMADAIVGGIGLAQRVPGPNGFYLQRWDPGDLICSDLGNGKRNWQVQTATGIEDITPGRWILFFPYGEIDPHKRGMWRALMLPWLLKRLALEDRASGSQQAGLSNPVVEAPEGATERQRQTIAAEFADEVQKLALVLPAGWKASYLQPPTKIFEIYSESIAWSDSAITITLAGQVVTTEGSPGFSSGNVQDQIRVDLIRYDAETLSSTLHDQDLIWLARELGYQDPSIATPYLVWNTTRPVDREQLARTIEILGRGVEALDKKLIDASAKVDLVRLCDLMQIPLLKVAAQKRDVQSSLLNGAQISSIVTIVEKVALFQIPRASGVQLLISTLQVDPDAAEKLIDEAGRSFQPLPAPGAAPPSGAPPEEETDKPLSKEQIEDLIRSFRKASNV
jgi:hypothetical protein